MCLDLGYPSCPKKTDPTWVTTWTKTVLHPLVVGTLKALSIWPNLTNSYKFQVFIVPNMQKKSPANHDVEFLPRLHHHDACHTKNFQYTWSRPPHCSKENKENGESFNLQPFGSCDQQLSTAPKVVTYIATPYPCCMSSKYCPSYLVDSCLEGCPKQELHIQGQRGAALTWLHQETSLLQHEGICPYPVPCPVQGKMDHIGGGDAYLYILSRCKPQHVQFLDPLKWTSFRDVVGVCRMPFSRSS